MTIKRHLIAIALVFGLANVLVFYLGPDDKSNAGVTTSITSVDAKGPSVESIVHTSISSIQRQSQLLVLTSRMNATGTSTYRSMGMEAWQIDITSSEVQYLVDLSRLNDKIFIDKMDITIVFPRTALIVKQANVEKQPPRDNGSWLLTFSDDVRNHLTLSNQKQINKSLMTQAQSQKDAAYASATVSLTTLLEATIKAAGLPHRVHVLFKDK